MQQGLDVGFSEKVTDVLPDEGGATDVQHVFDDGVGVNDVSSLVDSCDPFLNGVNDRCQLVFCHRELQRDLFFLQFADNEVPHAFGEFDQVGLVFEQFLPGELRDGNETYRPNPRAVAFDGHTDHCSQIAFVLLLACHALRRFGLAGDNGGRAGFEDVANDVGVSDFRHFQVEVSFGVANLSELRVGDDDVDVEHARDRFGDFLYRVPDFQESDHGLPLLTCLCVEWIPNTFSI